MLMIFGWFDLLLKSVLYHLYHLHFQSVIQCTNCIWLLAD